MMHTRVIASLTWEHCKDPVDDHVCNDLEQELGVKFPTLFRDIMRLCHGGTPKERYCFRFQHPRLGDFGSGVGALLSLESGDEDNILTVMEDLSYDEQLPDKVIPFAEDGGGDMMCLDYREDPGHPKVVYWSHEEEKDKSIIPLADSFTDFLAMLEPPEPLPERD